MLGPGIPAISPITGGFASAMRGDFGTFRNARNYRSRPNIEYPREKYDDSGDDIQSEKEKMIIMDHIQIHTKTIDHKKQSDLQVIYILLNIGISFEYVS